MIRSRTHIAFYTTIWTAISVAFSAWIAFGVVGMDSSRVNLISVIACPLVIVPIVAILSGRMMLKLHRLRQRLQHSMDHDTLTNTVTRQCFFGKIQSLENDISSSFLMVDIDHFKAINDSHGNCVGDIVIRETAHRLINNTRREDIVARFGGEEFVVLLKGATRTEAEQVAERMRATVARTPIRTSASKIAVTVSIGVGHMESAQTAQSALQEAEDALYRAKVAGHDLVTSAA